MQLFNKSKRQFGVSSGLVNPENAFTVPNEEGEKLLKMYSDELIKIGDAEPEVAESKPSSPELIKQEKQEIKKHKKSK